MKYIIDTKDNLKALDAQILQLGKNEELFLSSDTNYATILKHPFLNDFALPVIENYTALFQQSDLDRAIELDGTWFGQPLSMRSKIIEEGELDKVVFASSQAFIQMRAKAGALLQPPFNWQAETVAALQEVINKKEQQYQVMITSTYIDEIMKKIIA